MAMMMTGRVLLVVCALCVLWCGAAMVMAEANVDKSTEMKKDESFESSELVAGIVSAEQHVTQDSVREVSENGKQSLGAQTGNGINQDNGGIIASPASTVRGEEEEEEGETEEIEELTSSIEGEETSQLTLTQEGVPPPSEPLTTTLNGNPAGTLNATPAKGQSSSDDGSAQEEGLKSPTLKAPAAPAAPAAAAEATTTQTKDENPFLADDPLVQHVEASQHDMESRSASRKEGSIPTTVTKTDGPTEVNAESTPTSPSASKGAITNDADEGNEEGIPKHDQAPDGEATKEAQQGENKEENANKTATLEAAAITNDTATIGDSDGSTAVSHSTSPLLLLLVVACASAAAVVAA
ncbi:Mucin-associated surface protein (MASP) subgroup S072 [Trypanosoma cruzi]|uniref:Mucin-associated surface protein (MASP), putative n=2 Tax=Trypanosoma cruzi TaxID=5693 RepID=Q4CU24_TRYCC|nr:mucin-associated surface protein (MASP), putative [Trypanosoma cruzi]EAN83776.1 mucin-associated surface protein (MASP), putative [Trypanosoma cruzi]KAF5215123.1 Mucin-associated surface protein (MASP) subgroup S072 [Trypanosoma cruzi]|eukprot:XP_805627.1 mucin-associated surface protein (MASP) [Trypanosoma cruzi strain CL Brener]